MCYKDVVYNYVYQKKVKRNGTIALLNNEKKSFNDNNKRYTYPTTVNIIKQESMTVSAFRCSFEFFFF